MQPTTKPRVGVFGGTFDPVHIGHLILAEQCREQAGLDEVWFIPAPRPPQKQRKPVTAFAHRVEMLSLAIAGNPSFRIDELEKDRTGPSYTVDTLQELTVRDPSLDLHFIMGSDSLRDLPVWHKPARIVELATLVIAVRPSHLVPPLTELRQAMKLPETTAIRLQVVQTLFVDISSTDLRCRVQKGRSLRYLVPRAVECYIQQHRLYQEEDDPEKGGERGQL